MNRFGAIWKWLLFASMFVALALGTFVKPIRARQAPSSDPLQSPKVVSPLYVVTFVDLMPQNAVAGTAATKKYAIDTRKDPGIVRAEVIAQTGGRANHIVVIEVWKDEASFEKHEAASHTVQYRTIMQPLIGAPFDQRSHFLVE